MPNPADQPASLSRVDRKIAAARLALGFERLWSALHWPIVILMAAAALVIGGVLPMLPAWPRLAVLVLLSAGFLWSLRGLTRVRWPGRTEAMRRVEEKSGLVHRPVSARDDRLADGAADPLQQAIWEEHRLRQFRALGSLKAGAPRSAWRDIDPTALRVPAALALAAALLLGPGDPRGNLADSLAFTTSGQAAELSLDAWLKPPAYTGKPPVLLTSAAMAERLKSEPEIATPENSVLSLRISGAKQPSLSFLTPGEADAAPLSGFKSSVKQSDGLFQAEVTLDRPATVRVTDGTRELGSWRISLIPDAPPAITITEDPSGDGSGMMTAKWKASDDYGVAGITADIYLADEQDEGTGFTDAGIFEFDPPKFPVSLRKANPKEEAGQSRADVAEHPWAGFMVEMTLTARDAAGHSTESAKRVFRLPERQFMKPLARALVEQRRRLILSPENQQGVSDMLDALLTYPQGLIERSGTHLALAATLSRLKSASSRDEIDAVIRSLWQIAVQVEDGAYADAKAELQALRKQLEQALREGAPPERIAELMDKLRKAMDRYLQSMMEEAQKRMGEAPQKQSPQAAKPGRSISPQELQKMLDQIQKLAQSGSSEAAQQLLSELENILRNLQPGMAQQGEMQDGPMSEMLDKLSELMRRQQKLMDDTQRLPQDGGSGQDPQEGQQGQQGAPGAGGEGSGLGDRQKGLGQMLKELMEQMGENGVEAPRALGEAGKSMEGAEGSLRGGDREGALGRQGDAMEKLREGAQGLAKKLLEQAQGQQGGGGRDGEAQGERDPLGRPMPSRGQDTGPNRDMLPSELAIQRAREILEMLRSRAGDSALPKVERDYIDRLLRGLY